MTNTAALALVPSPAAVFAAGLLDTPPSQNLVPEGSVLNPDHAPHLDVIEEIEQEARERAEWEAERWEREAQRFC